MSNKSTKKALLTSVLALVLCCSMLIGTTFAWFTDTASTGVNTIISGKLDVVLEYSLDKGITWAEAKEPLNFVAADGREEILWEPGCTYELPMLRVRNAGNLALKYQFVISGLTGDAELLDVIEWYVNDQPMEVTYTGKLAPKATSEGLTLKGHMKEDAGNDYMDKKIENISISVYATQLNYESDSYGPDYDGGAPWTGAADTSWYDPEATELTIGSAEELAGLAKLVNEGTDKFAGKTIKLSSNIDLNGMDWIPIGTSTRNAFNGTFDGQGHTIKNIELMPGSGKYGAGLFGNLLGGSVVKNLNIDGATCNVRANCAGVVTGYVYGSATFENINITNADVAAFGKVGGIIGLVADPGAHTITMNNCNVEGTFTGTYNMGGLVGLVLQGVTVNMTNCTTDVDFVLTDTSYNKPYKQNADGTWGWVFEDWTYAAVAENFCYCDAAENEQFNGVAKNVEVKVSTTIGLTGVLEAAVANGEKDIVVDAQRTNIGNLSYTLNTKLVPAGTTVTIKNAVVEGKSYGNGVDGTVVFENCTFNNPNGAYSIHFDNGSGHVVFKNCTLTGWCSFGSAIKSVTMKNCTIQGNGRYGIVRFYQDATMTNCHIDVSNVNATDVYHDGVSAVNCKLVMTGCTLDCCDYETAEGGIITIDGIPVVTDNDELIKAITDGATDIYLANGEYDLNGIQKNDLTLIGVDSDVKVANTTRYASGKAVGAITKAIHLENVTITNTVYTMENGGNATFTNVYFAAGFRQGYGKAVVFNNCTFGSNSEGYALHFQTDSASEGGEIKLNGCKFEGGKVHLGGKRAYSFTGCDFAAGTDFQIWSNITLENCTVNGEKVTEENIANLFSKLNLTNVTIK